MVNWQLTFTKYYHTRILAGNASAGTSYQFTDGCANSLTGCVVASARAVSWLFIYGEMYGVSDGICRATNVKLSGS